MLARFDILNEQPQGDFLWLEAVATLEAAASRVAVLSCKLSGRIVVFDQHSQSTVSVAECHSQSRAGYGDNAGVA